RLVRADERLLRHVLGLGPIPEHVDGEAMDSLLVAPDEVPERVAVAGARAAHQIAIGGGGHACWRTHAVAPRRALAGRWAGRLEASELRFRSQRIGPGESRRRYRVHGPQTKALSPSWVASSSRARATARCRVASDGVGAFAERWEYLS